MYASGVAFGFVVGEYVSRPFCLMDSLVDFKDSEASSARVKRVCVNDESEVERAISSVDCPASAVACFISSKVLATPERGFRTRFRLGIRVRSLGRGVENGDGSVGSGGKCSSGGRGANKRKSEGGRRWVILPFQPRGRTPCEIPDSSGLMNEVKAGKSYADDRTKK